MAEAWMQGFFEANVLELEQLLSCQPRRLLVEGWLRARCTALHLYGWRAAVEPGGGVSRCRHSVARAARTASGCARFQSS